MKHENSEEMSTPLSYDFYLLEDKESKAAPPLPSSRIDWRLIKSILTETWNRIMCFDYSAALLALVYGIGQLKDDKGDNTHYKAALY